VSCGLRDVLELERMGRPAALVASSAFVDAAEAQSAALGQPAARRVFVDHPVQDRTDEELQEMARSTVDPVLLALSGPASRAPADARL
jgi:hypothetical protein